MCLLLPIVGSLRFSFYLSFSFVSTRAVEHRHRSTTSLYSAEVSLSFQADFQLNFTLFRSSRFAYFVLSDKVCKALFFVTVRKCKELSSQFRTLSFFATLSAHLCGKLKSVLIDNFCVSAPCFEGALFRTSLFKTALFYCDRYFLLLPPFVHFALPSASIYSLLAPVVAI